MATREVKEKSEREELEAEKIQLARKLGIWERFEPIEGYETSAENKRINEIDQRLAEIING